LKNLLKNNLVVVPACLFDTNIKVNFKVMYAVGKEYSDKRTREVSVDISQV
jgi:tmRNA-binding protein